MTGCLGSGAAGEAQFYVKDAASDDLTSIVITITQVTVHAKGLSEDKDAKEGGSESESADLEEKDVETNDSAKPDSSWVVLSDQTHTVDLMQFSGTARDFVGSAALPPGEYTQLRLSISQAYGVLKSNGTRVDIKVPSQTLKINHKWDVEQDKSTLLTLDFQLDKSIVKKEDGSYAFKPVLKLHKEKKSKDAAKAERETAEKKGKK